MPISEVETGDTVHAYHEATGEVGEYTVTHTHVHDDPAIAYLTIDGEVIETTPNHPFYTAEGWKVAGNLEAGDRIRALDGRYGVVVGEVIGAVGRSRFFHNISENIGRTWQHTRGIDDKRVIIELFSGPRSQIDRRVPGYQPKEVVVFTVDINPRGNPNVIPGDATNLHFRDDFADQIFITNPFNESLREAGHSAMDRFKMDFYREAARVLKPGGELIVSATQDNRYAKLLSPNGELRPEIKELGFRLQQPYDPIRPNSPYSTLHPALQGAEFGRPDADGSVIPASSMRTLILSLGG